jgi:DNA-binding response OmpR family regulator
VDHKILIIDDSQAVNELVSRFLENNGYSVAAISNPRQALDGIAAFEPDLVVLDLNMPYITGWELCLQIKAAHTLPVIVFSVQGEDVDIERAFSAGADDYIIKPFEFPDLLQRINRILRENDAAS